MSDNTSKTSQYIANKRTAMSTESGEERREKGGRRRRRRDVVGVVPVTQRTGDTYFENGPGEESGNKRADSPSVISSRAFSKSTLPLLPSIVPRVVLTVCYDAISRNVNDVGYSPFVMFSVSSATILPSCLVILFLQDRVGRKGMASVSLLSTGLFTAASGIILACRKSNMLLTASLAIVGRFGVNIAYNSGAQYAAELIPTEVRGQGVAAIHVAGYAATFFSPYILYMVSGLIGQEPTRRCKSLIC
uniref:Major facilitator superfamily (MFS) profile domain-containing protein n=1 Tax=Timema tahoe TaxID=61484 RepID=A0A7R9IRD9_9NEOP|nr:unnamed protein product [Timema tahoe]